MFTVGHQSVRYTQPRDRIRCTRSLACAPDVPALLASVAVRASSHYLGQMANTSALQEAIQWVRGELGRRHERSFDKREVQLRTGARRSFNAVSADGRFVCTVMNSSGLTSGGKKPVGKIRGAIAEVYYLSLADAPDRLLIATDPDFFAMLQRELDGALVDGVGLLHLPLPAALAAKVSDVTAAASSEMGG